MLRQDWLTFVFRFIFLFGAAITALFAMDNETIGQRGEFYLLLIVATLGMNLMASSADLIMLYLAIETTSIPLYVLAGFLTRDPKSTEAGLKYLLFGALTSTIMLYGFSLLYGFTGTTNLYDLVDQFKVNPAHGARRAAGGGRFWFQDCRRCRSTSGRRTCTKARPPRWLASFRPLQRRPDLPC